MSQTWEKQPPSRFGKIRTGRRLAIKKIRWFFILCVRGDLRPEAVLILSQNFRVFVRPPTSVATKKNRLTPPEKKGNLKALYFHLLSILPQMREGGRPPDVSVSSPSFFLSTSSVENCRLLSFSAGNGAPAQYFASRNIHSALCYCFFTCGEADRS